MGSAIARASKSELPPAEYGTTIRIGLSGKAADAA
jgi:hypothetical protein